MCGCFQFSINEVRPKRVVFIRLARKRKKIYVILRESVLRMGRYFTIFVLVFSGIIGTRALSDKHKSFVDGNVDLPNSLTNSEYLLCFLVSSLILWFNNVELSFYFVTVTVFRYSVCY